MQTAADLLCGTHDYKSFCGNKKMKKSTVRTIFRITVEQDAGSGLVKLEFEGNGFLQNMVRILTGTLIEVGLGKRDAGSMPEILAALDRPTAGEILLNGKNTVEIKNKELSAFRRTNLGFVFQDFNLLDTFSLKDNIFLPLVLSGEQYPQMMQKLEPIAKKLEITHLLEKYPYEVSGGQKQRAAVARALITQPQLILADEPTGALDSRSTDQLLDLFQSINEDGQTIVMVTHSTKAASRAKRVLFIKDGEVFHQIYKANMSDEEMYAKISAALTVLATGGEQGE